MTPPSLPKSPALEKDNESDWRSLIERFCPADKRICNCGEAYYTFFPASERKAFVAGEPVDHWGCRHGCQAAQYQAKMHVAHEVTKLLVT